MSDLGSAVQTLAAARKLEADAREMLNEINVEVNAAIAERFGRSLRAAQLYLQDIKANVASADSAVRKLAVQVHPVIKAHPAVTVKEYVTLEYTDDDALAYCRRHLPGALKLGKRLFEKAAKIIDMDFVTFGTEPRATIKRDLSAWLPGGEGDDA